jgi:reactive chlorine resistance protein C
MGGGESMLAGSSVSTRAVELERIGISILRYALVLILLYFGAFKFTMAEARGIQPLVEHSPLLSWLYSLLSVNGVSRVVGVSELTIAGLILSRPWLPRLSALGSLAAIGMFLITLSFLLSTPGLWQWVEGFPAPTEASAFLLKDVFLLGAAIVTAGEAGKRPGALRGGTPISSHVGHPTQGNRRDAAHRQR